MSEQVTVTVGSDYVATVEFDRPPHNHFDVELIAALADTYKALDADDSCRAILLCSTGPHFCAGANFGAGPGDVQGDSLYSHAVRLFAAATPVVVAVQGAAIGGGLGLALSADFRVASPSTRFAGNFARLGIHHGFGITVTLPGVVGQQAALDLLYTGRRVKGEEARALGLCDRLAGEEELRAAAGELAGEIAASAPLAVRSIRQTMRGDLADRVRVATAREHEQQTELFASEDFREGVLASTERRPPRFSGR